MTAVIVDDEPLSIDVIATYLAAFPDIALIGRFTNSQQALDKLLVLQPDLLFLDVQLPVMDGFALLEALGDRHRPYVIFTTAYEQYAIRAFEAHAAGYLLKPLDRDKFTVAVNRFREHYLQQQPVQLYADLLQLVRTQREQAAYQERIMIREQQRIFYISVEAVHYFEAAGDYVRVVTDKQTHLLNDSLTGLEQRLDPARFIRIHRSLLVRAAAIREFLPYHNGEYVLVLHQGARLKTSRSFKANLLRVFGEL